MGLSLTHCHCSEPESESESELSYKSHCNVMHFLTLVVPGFPSHDPTQKLYEEMLKHQVKKGIDMTGGSINVTARTK